MAGWTESLHPRAPKGKTGGGRFASAQGGGGPMKGAAAKAQAHHAAARNLRGQMRLLGQQIRSAQKAAAASVTQTAHMGPLPVKPVTGSVSGGSMGSKGVSMTIPKPKKAAKAKAKAKTKTKRAAAGSSAATAIPLTQIAPAVSLPLMRQRMAFLQAQHAAHMNRAAAYQRLAAGWRPPGMRPFGFAGDTPAIELGGTVKTPAPQRAAGRKKLAKAGDALPDGSFPIPTVDYLKKAIRSAGRAPASKRPALKALIRKRAKALGAVNAPGVKGTWAFQGSNDDSEALEMAMPPRKTMPMVRGAADVQCSRTAPGAVNVMHKSTGVRVGTLTSKGGTWTGVHSTGKMTGPSDSMPGALSALIAMHNKMAGGNPMPAPRVKAMANDGQHIRPTRAKLSGVTVTATKGESILTPGTIGGSLTLSGSPTLVIPSAPVELAGSLPFTSAATSSDGPRVTTMGGAGKTKAMAAVKLKTGLSTEGVTVYKKLRKKGMPHGQALALAKRAGAMKAKAASPKASAASRAA